MSDKNIKKLKETISKLSEKEKLVLKIASNAIYFNDKKDYLDALWKIVDEISDFEIKDCNTMLYKLLNYEEEK